MHLKWYENFMNVYGVPWIWHAREFRALLDLRAVWKTKMVSLTPIHVQHVWSYWFYRALRPKI